jgi:hypothetical protein
VKGPATITVTALLLLGAGGWLLLFAGTHVAYAAGLAGTPGRLRIETCLREPVGGHRYPRCTGVFRSSDGRVVDRAATMSEDLPVGGTLVVRRTASGGYEETGFGQSCGWLAVSLIGVLVADLGALLVCVLLRARRARRAGLALLGWAGAAALLSALVGGVTGIASLF